MQIMGMVQREFDQRQREMRKALKAENDENDMRVRLPDHPAAFPIAITSLNDTSRNAGAVSAPLGRMPGRVDAEGKPGQDAAEGIEHDQADTRNVRAFSSPI